MEDQDVLTQINSLASEEHELYQRAGEDGLSDQEHRRLKAIEVQLDQCWDLLRQRRALRDIGGDPREAEVRPAGQVEGYLG